MTNFFKRMFNHSSKSTGSEKNNPLHQMNAVIINVLKENKDVDLFSLKWKYKYWIMYQVFMMEIHVRIVMMYGEYVHKWNCGSDGGRYTRTLNKKMKRRKNVVTLFGTNCEMRFLDKIVIVECLDFDKYGRLLVYIHPYNDNMKIDKKTSYNQWLIDNNYAAEYYGGTKYDQDWDIKNMQKIKKYIYI